jgi:Guanylate-binding protein, N-terminal domain
LIAVLSCRAAPYSDEDDDDDDSVEITPFDNTHPYGEPKVLMNPKQTADDLMTIDFKAIVDVFRNPELADRKIVVVSVVGAYRKGKSFLMDYCLRFMYANVSGNSHDFD